MNLKIITYNIHKGFSTANLRFVLHEIKDALETAAPDLVFLQEIQGVHTKHGKRMADWPDKPQSLFLAENLWPYYAYGKNAFYKDGHHGNTILSKFPFIAWENIDVGRHKRSSRSLLHGILNIPEVANQVHVICIHLALFKTARAKQLARLHTRIAEFVPANAPLIVAGDFNDWRGHAEHYLETNLGLLEAFKTMYGCHAKTFPSWRPTLAVDRIYYRNIKLTTCQRLNEQPWNRLSDHIPLYAEFTLG